MTLEATEAGLALLVLLGLIVWLGRTSTTRLEVERDHASAAREQQAQAAGRAAHPAGQRAGWWLVDGSAVVAGPFPDRIEADWTALSAQLSDSVHRVYGVCGPTGGVARRQSPQEQAWLVELGRQLDRLTDDWDGLLTDSDTLTTLLVEVSAALLEAGLTLHDSTDDDAAGGVCLVPDPGGRGILVTWRQHDRISVDRVHGPELETAVQRTMSAAIAEVLTEMGFPVTPVGTSNCHLVTATQRSASTP
ncbi:hypothetical protein [Geodermatophilus sp. DSM 44513]|uniref:hypothetical protein n=1 Tax=Geodermatophilus sp. DSM 44513 TaxID=1528104 RepID=UPI001281B942|nr:hypothetical protein [Geodermatophilus sp. DSM 44513]WNV75142.1 hypothetical protein RTG05_19450 [Geodermatophilus sp. DSM 44513]